MGHSLPVAAQALNDNVESGTLLLSDNPAGKWNSYSATVGGNSMAATGAAAHRGSFGIRHTDTDSRTGQGGQNHLNYNFSTTTADLYFRMWFRIASSNGQGANSSLATLDGTDWVVDLSVQNFTSRRLLIGGWSGSPKSWDSATSSTGLA